MLTITLKVRKWFCGILYDNNIKSRLSLDAEHPIVLKPTLISHIITLQRFAFRVDVGWNYTNYIYPKKCSIRKKHYEYKMLIPVIRLTFLRMSSVTFGTRVFACGLLWISWSTKTEVFSDWTFLKWHCHVTLKYHMIHINRILLRIT